MAATAQTGFQWGGETAISRGVLLDSTTHGANFSGSEVEAPQNRGIRARGIALGPQTTHGAQFAPTTLDTVGGQWDGPVDDSVSSLIDTEGFALVLEKRSRAERLAFSPDQPTYRDIKTVGWVSEVNNMASWSATVPTDPELYSFPFSRVVIGYNGERRFHGVLLPVEHGAIHDGELTLSGYGPLFWAGHDVIRVEYADMASHRALEDLWRIVAQETNGRVRGNVVRPQTAHINDHWIPEEGVEWSGTPLEVLKSAHGYAGQAFSCDHSEQATIFTSFVPGEELREAEWRAKQGGVKPQISPEGYHNQITVVGGTKPGVGEQSLEAANRYSATVTAPRPEIDRLMGGEIHGRTARDDSLESDAACHARATTLLAEDRGEWTVGGSLETTPTRTPVPGYTYHVDEFDDYAPELFVPVFCTLQSVEHSYGPGEAATTLDFEEESGLTEHIRQDLAPDAAPGTIKRRSAQLHAADSNYNRPANLAYEFGAGVWGSGKFGGTHTEESQQ